MTRYNYGLTNRDVRYIKRSLIGFESEGRVTPERLIGIMRRVPHALTELTSFGRDSKQVIFNYDHKRLIVSECFEDHPIMMYRVKVA